jgi:hypothetical protein
VRIRIAIPPEELGNRLDQMNAWLDANCGADEWNSTSSSTRGVVNDALAVYFLDATIASDDACAGRGNIGQIGAFDRIAPDFTRLVWLRIVGRPK